jgi:hypothetical protein
MAEAATRHCDSTGDLADGLRELAGLTSAAGR